MIMSWRLIAVVALFPCVFHAVNAQSYIGFSTTQYAVNEGDGWASITINRSGNITVTSSVNLTISPGSAMNGSDYLTTGPQVVRFKVGDRSMAVNITIINDVVVERSEYFTVILTASDPFTNMTLPSANVSITDDDKAVVMFVNSSLAVSEGQGFVSVCIEKQGSTAIDLTVKITATTSNDTNLADFTSMTDAPITLPANQMVTCFNVTIKDDDVTEADEKFMVMLSSSDPSVTLVVNKTKVEVTILNNDKVTAEFESPLRYIVKEGEKINLTCVITSGTHDTPVTVNFLIDKIFTTTDSSDITLPLAVVFSAHVNKTTVDVTVEADGKAESNEVFTVRMVSGDPSRVLIGKNSTITGKIDDEKDRDDQRKKEEQKKKDTDKQRNTYLILISVATAVAAVILIIVIIILCCLVKMVKE